MTPPRTRMLLLPGLEGSGELFAGLIEELGTGFETRSARYPAECRTYADAEDLVRQLMVDSRASVIVAESYSTPLAIKIAAELQDEIDGLVLCNGFAVNPLGGLESLMATLSAPWFFHMPLTDVAARVFLVGPEASDGLVEAVHRVIAPVAPAVLGARLRAVLECDARDALGRIRIPMLYLRATRDRLIGEASLREILRVKPDVQVERVDGPHLLLQKEPRQCAELIGRFVEGVSLVRTKAAD